MHALPAMLRGARPCNQNAPAAARVRADDGLAVQQQILLGHIGAEAKTVASGRNECVCGHAFAECARKTSVSLGGLYRLAVCPDLMVDVMW